ncbi:MAG: hypothetical protein GY800_08910 [Planctomycetes bacterium]|nr:hypothetical protein [Planctomycetota bacterium]
MEEKKLIVKTQETYRCPYCRKLYVIKHAAEKHIKFCGKNPKNEHACFKYFCEHLVRTREIEDGDSWGRTQEYTEFTCKLTGKTMWSYIAERNGYIDRGVTCADERMPLECDILNEELKAGKMPF